MKVRLTKKIVESIEPRTGDLILWDTQLVGFGLKVTPKGRRTYFLYYRGTGGVQRRPTIGVHGQVTADEPDALRSDG